ncbi:unnamed protein product [Peniophora sp. CBMAI 1063]|nr:unnamed protein product [Peniophora sp. CBMAI 1063]
MTHLCPTSNDIVRVDTYARIALYALSSVTSIFGRDVAAEGALRVVTTAWDQLSPEARPSLVEFAKNHFTTLWMVTDERHQGLPPGCVSFRSHPRFRFDAPLYGDTYGDTGARQQYIIDAPIPAGYQAIPSTLFSPYAGQNPRRNVAIRSRVNPIPILFFVQGGSRDGCLGIPVDKDDNGGVGVLNGLHKLQLLESRSSLKIKFDWPHYERSDGLDRQIRRALNPAENNLQRLAMLVAGAVRNYMADNRKVRKNDSTLPQYWTIGERPGEINIRDVLLLGVIRTDFGPRTF